MDDVRHVSPPPTRPGDKKTIDYGICHTGAFPDAAYTTSGLADHKLVMYDVPISDNAATFATKKWPVQTPRNREEVCNLFSEDAFATCFSSAHDADGMWRALSSFADAALFNCSPELRSDTSLGILRLVSLTNIMLLRLLSLCT